MKKNSNSPFANSITPARIMVVDNHPIVRAGLAAILAPYPYWTLTTIMADHVSSVLKQLRQNLPNVVIVEISSMGDCGLNLIRQIKEQHEATRVLVLSVHDESLFGERVLAAGAAGYVSKHAALRQIIDALLCVLGGGFYFNDCATRRRPRLRNIYSQSQQPLGISSLTDRQLQVFSLIGQGLTTSQVAGKMHLSVKTIETHRQKIKGKLKLRNTAQLSQEATRWVLLNR